MRVFVTGATGLVGSAVTRELLDAGHQVTGLARSDTSAAALTAAGADVHRGTLADLDGIRAAASAADGVIHTAFNHDFTDFAASIATDRGVIAAIGDTLAGSDRPFVIASGLGGRTVGRVATEDGEPDDLDHPAAARLVTEQGMLALAERGVRASAVRLPPTVHGAADTHGFMPTLIKAARTNSAALYPGDGANRWPAVHQLDAAHLFVLALEKAPAGSPLHAVGDEGVPVREIAESIAAHLGLPAKSAPADEMPERIGFVGSIFALDIPASSAKTQALLDWHPVQPGLLADLDAGHYFGDRR
jgi:nucleoside-diphosphate-sugar epimerase